LAKPHRLREVEQEHDQPLEQLIPELLAELGTQKAVADRLGVSQATISVWLSHNCYVPKVIYVQKEESHEPAC
jgi:hypothetical protein